MTDQNIMIFLEFPPNVAQQEIQDLEEALKHIQGVETDLQTTRGLGDVITLVIEIAGSISIVAGSIKSAYEVSEILYKFLHHENKEKTDEGKRKIVLKQGNKAIELYNYSLEEIRQLFSQKK